MRRPLSVESRGSLAGTTLVAALLLGLFLAPAAQARPLYDLWVQSVRVDSLYAAMDALGNPLLGGQSDPLVFTIEVGKCGEAPVPPTKFLHFRLNGSDVQAWTLTGDTLQTFQYTVTGTLLTDAVCWIDQGSDEYYDNNNQLIVQVTDHCLCSLSMPDPDGSGDLQLTLFKNAGTTRSHRYAYALLILPPYDRQKAQPEGTMSTTMTVTESASQSDEFMIGVTASIGIGTKFSLAGIEAEVGEEIETQWESASGTASERSKSDTFSASTEAAAAESADHLVVLSETFYYLCDYDVTSGSRTGERVIVAVPQDDPTWGNPQLFPTPLSDYEDVSWYDGLWLNAGCTVGDLTSYGKTPAPQDHVGGNGSIVRSDVVFEQGRTVSTAGRNWGVTLSESNWNSQSLNVNMTAKASFLGMEYSCGTENGYTHSVVEGKSASFDFQIGGTQSDADQYRAAAYMANLLVDHSEAGNPRRDRLMLVDYYVPLGLVPGADNGQNEEDQATEEATRAVEEAKESVPDPSGLQEIIDALVGLLTNPDDWYMRFKAVMQAFSNWLEQWLGTDSAYPRAGELHNLVNALIVELDVLLATPTNDAAWPYRAAHAWEMLRDVAYLTEVVFCPDPSRLQPEIARAGGQLNIIYEPSKGTLNAPSALELGVSMDGGDFVYQSMAEDTVRGVWAATVDVPSSAVSLAYQFRDDGIVDDRMGFGWQVPVASAAVQDHDNANFKLSLTSQGIVGTTGGDSPAGGGFVYPATGTNRLAVGSLWLGNATAVANRDHDADPAPEWQASARAPGGIWRYDGDKTQVTFAAFTDSAASTPRGLIVTQGAVSREDAPDDDYAIVMYHVSNESGATQEGLYLGLFADFQLGSTAAADMGGTDDSLDLAYMYGGTSSAYVGVCALMGGVPSGPPASANRTLIDVGSYLPSPGYVPDADKYGFLAATPGHRIPVASTPADWGALVSIGPFRLLPGQSLLVGFAIVGGESLQDLKDNATRARAWWSPLRSLQVGVESGDALLTAPQLTAAPNPFNPRTEVAVTVPAEGPGELRIYDIRGRVVRTLHRGWLAAGTTRLTWDGRDESGQAVGAGIYLCRLITRAGWSTAKLILVR